MTRDTVRQSVNVVATVATVVVNGLANALPINNQTTGEIANRIPVGFLPANYVFSIWGLIYLALTAFTVYQALPEQRENPLFRRIGYLYAVTAAANITWLLWWHYEQFVLSNVAMLALLLALIAIYLRLDIGRRRFRRAERWFAQVPFSIYLGWITVAMVANISYTLAWAGWDGWGISGVAWTVIMIVASAAIATLLNLTRPDGAYTAVIIWALSGIAVRHAGVPPILIACLLMILVVALARLIGQIVQRREEIVTP